LIVSSILFGLVHAFNTFNPLIGQYELAWPWALFTVAGGFFFGLLHWAGGFWYILLTGLVAGGLFAGLYTARKNMIAPFAAHLVLNLVEFLFTWLVM